MTVMQSDLFRPLNMKSTKLRFNKNKQSWNNIKSITLKIAKINKKRFFEVWSL